MLIQADELVTIHRTVCHHETFIQTFIQCETFIFIVPLSSEFLVWNTIIPGNDTHAYMLHAVIENIQDCNWYRAHKVASSVSIELDLIWIFYEMILIALNTLIWSTFLSLVNIYFIEYFDLVNIYWYVNVTCVGSWLHSLH